MKKHLFLALALAAVASLAACGGKEDGQAAGVPEVEKPYIDSLKLYGPGEYDSKYWRIPALLCLDDGTVLAVNDKRKYSPYDLPQDIDVVVRRSTDGGLTWSDPATIAEGQGVGFGYGDPALVQCENGDVLCLFAGHNGYFQSSAANPINVYLSRSTDRGLSWSAPQTITSVLWDAQSNYHGAFVASGNGLRLRQGPHAGRLLFAASMVRKGQNVSDDYVIYSDDNGISWQRSALAYQGGDESKVIELADGTVLLSVRQQGARGYNHSTDGGETWGTQGTWPEMTTNACNGDMLRVNDTLLIHSIPNSTKREDVSLYLSTDEGASWHSPAQLIEGPSVYSSLTMLPDGKVGCYVEVGPDTCCELWLYRFNTAWLLGR